VESAIPPNRRVLCDHSKRNCNYQSLVVRPDAKFSELKPTLVWRGGNYPFLATHPEGMTTGESVQAVSAAVDALARENVTLTAQNILDRLDASGEANRVTPRLRAVLIVGSSLPVPGGVRLVLHGPYTGCRHLNVL
jgi:hypothetical protein